MIVRYVGKSRDWDWDGDEDEDGKRDIKEMMRQGQE